MNKVEEVAREPEWQGAIPEDVFAKARSIASAAASPDLPDLLDIMAITNALLSERNATRNATLEEAAVIADTLIEERRGLSLSFDMIATAIRKEKT